MCMPFLILVPYCLDYCSFVIKFEVRKYDSPTLFLFFKTILAIQSPLHFHMNCRISLPISTVSMLRHTPPFSLEHLTRKQTGKIWAGVGTATLNKVSTQEDWTELKEFISTSKMEQGWFCASNKASQGQRWWLHKPSASLSPNSGHGALPLAPPLKCTLFHSALSWPLVVVPAHKELPCCICIFYIWVITESRTEKYPALSRWGGLEIKGKGNRHAHWEI